MTSKGKGFAALLLIALTTGFGQNIYTERANQFLSFEKIPTWTCVASEWNTNNPVLHLYDSEKYKGHAQFVSLGLKTGISFKAFKEKVKYPESREYLPFFLFDLRDISLKTDGAEYKWAVRIEDYAYQDNNQEMQEAVLRLMNMVSDYIKAQSGVSLKGIIILATNSKSKPNTAISGYLNQNAYPDLTISELLKKTGGKKIEVLNPVNGVGYLRYIKAGEEDHYRPDYKDILIYEYPPKRIYPVSGIITLTPQTPLSHINLLAKNRGTLNLYAVDLNSLPGADKLINKLVKISFEKDRLYLSESNIENAKAFWASRRKKIEIPDANKDLKGVIDLNIGDSAFYKTSYIGAKASNYAFIRHKFPKYVREAYAIPFKYYFDLIRNCGADTIINQLSGQDNNEIIRYKLKQIRQAILNADIAPAVIDEIRQLIIEKMKCDRIRLRSSTNCEDLPEFNGAGLYVSKGFNADDKDEKLVEKILKVYASLWSEPAYEERAYYFIDHTKAGMAILINEAFSDEYANGVAITIPEKKGCALHINAQYGENSVANPINGQIPESIRFNSINDDAVILSKSSVHNVFLEDTLKEKLMELKQILYEIHTALIERCKYESTDMFGTDIEFKIMYEEAEYKLFVKQARLLKVVLPE